MEKADLEEPLSETLRKSDLSILAEFGEIGIDSILAEGVLQDLPIFSTLISLLKAGVTVRDHLFAKKVMQFLTPLRVIPPSKRRKMVERLENDETYAHRVGEHVILLLDRLDNMRLGLLTRQ